MKRRELAHCLAGILAGVTVFAPDIRAQSGSAIPRIGVLRWGAPGDEAQIGLTRALADIGYRENETIRIAWRFATNRDLARRHAAELSALKLDLILASATPAALALRDVAGTVPIVMNGVADPVGVGLVQSLARPGGHMTGVSTNLPDMVPKQLQLLGEVLPGLQRAAFLGSTQDPATKLFVEQAREAAGALGVHMQVELVGQAGQFASALDTMLRERSQAVVVQPLFAVSSPGPLADLLAQRRLPAITAQLRFAASGGLLAYGFNRAELSRRTASFVDRVLKGAAPAGLPIEEPTTYELGINLATARTLGITVPQSLLLRAHEVIQ